MARITKKFIPFAKKMQLEGLPDIVIDTFKYYYTRLVEGQTGFIAETDIKPVESLLAMETFPSNQGKTVHKEYKKRLMTIYQRRLQKLKEQKASRGISTPPEVLIEIEDIEIEIEKLRDELELLNDNKFELCFKFHLKQLRCNIKIKVDCTR